MLVECKIKAEIRRKRLIRWGMRHIGNLILEDLQWFGWQCVSRELIPIYYCTRKKWELVILCTGNYGLEVDTISLQEKVFANWYVYKAMHDGLVVHHFTNRWRVVKAPGYPTRSSALYHFKHCCLLLGVRVPHCWAILHGWPYNRLVSFLFHVFALHLDISFQKA